MPFAKAPSRPKKKNNRNPNKLLEPRKNKEEQIPQPRVVVGPNSDHIIRYELDTFSEPLDWFCSLVPLYPDDNLEDLKYVDAIGDSKTKFCVSNWRGYTNLKAEMAGSGHKGE